MQIKVHGPTLKTLDPFDLYLYPKARIAFSSATDCNLPAIPRQFIHPWYAGASMYSDQC